MKHLHILGICGTFMGGLAVIARQLGYKVTGSDAAVYPPMSTALEKAGISIVSGYHEDQFMPRPDLVVIGNALSRGNPAVEYVLNHKLPYTSGPQWLAEHVLRDRQVLAVAGTHGKTTTTSLLTWILKQANLNPSYLIGGVAQDFAQSAYCDTGDHFVIEADEYDSAFFDKRSKFLHYRPDTLIINNLEFDHADIFSDLEAIKKQFQYLLRTVPAKGLLIYPANNTVIEDVMHRGCWSSTQTVGYADGDWQARAVHDDGSQFELWHSGAKQGDVMWNMLGQHNVYNALAASAAAHHVGVKGEKIVSALNTFGGVKRRLETIGQEKGITVYDDFAHHPTAFSTTLDGLRARVGKARIVAVVQFGSNTMVGGQHDVKDIARSFDKADRVLLWKPPSAQWDIEKFISALSCPADVYDTVSGIIEDLMVLLKSGDHVLIMSNKGFDGLHQKLIAQLKA